MSVEVNKHTPGELEVREDPYNDAIVTHLYAKHGNGRTIAMATPSYDPDYKANMERLVLAWNCHDKLVTALKDMQKVYEMMMPGVAHIAIQDYELLNMAGVNATAAIAKAEGK